MTPRTANIYPYYTSYKPLYNVTIVPGATTSMDNITVNSFIMVVNEALYYGNKLNHSLINPNQWISYGTIVWDNPLDTNMDICLETCEGNKIYFIPDGTNIGFSLHVPTEEELRNLPYIEVTSGS